jgi:hypothetical protein
MTISANDISAQARHVSVTDDSIIVDLTDGRTISVPIGWYPRLANATGAERKNFRMIGSGRGIHWEDLDEDVSVENLLLGRGSGESSASFAKWMAGRNKKA